MLCDEPSSALDPESRHIVESRLDELCTLQGKTVVLVTHLVTEPANHTPRRLRLSDGRLAEATP